MYLSTGRHNHSANFGYNPWKVRQKKVRGQEVNELGHRAVAAAVAAGAATGVVSGGGGAAPQ